MGLKEALTVHDVHHVLTAYPTTLKGECQLAGWGCRNLYGMSEREMLAAEVQALRERKRL